MSFRSPLFFGIILTIALGNPSTAQSWMFRGDLRHTGNFQSKAIENIREVRWAFPTDGPVRSSPAIVIGTVFVGSGDGNLYALDLASGKKKWAFDAGSAIHSSPAVTNESVFFTTRNGALVALRTGNGTQLWKFQMGADLPNRWAYDYYQSSPAVVNGSVLVGGGDGNLYSIDVKTGEEQWRFRAPARIRSSPAVDGGIVVVGDFAGHVYGIDLSSGRQLWKFDTEGAALYKEDFGFDRSAIVSSASIHNGVVTVGGRDGFLYALSLKDGKERWRFNHDISWVLTSPAISNGLAFAGSSDGRFVHAVDHQTGKEVWRFKTRGPVWGSPTVCGDVVYFGDYDGYLYSVESKTGKELSRFKTGHLIHSTPVPVDGMVLIGSDDGYLYALGGPTVRFPQTRDNQEKLSSGKRLPEIPGSRSAWVNGCVTTSKLTAMK
ncbi:MAG: PQQ-binding-like beta-propeller repeat protein [Bacteroidota bacterium]